MEEIGFDAMCLEPIVEILNDGRTPTPDEILSTMGPGTLMHAIHAKNPVAMTRALAVRIAH